MIRRYLIFAGDQYYADAGWRNYEGDFNDLDSAKRWAKGLDREWWQVVDLHERKIVAWEGHLYGNGPGPPDSADVEQK